MTRPAQLWLGGTLLAAALLLLALVPPHDVLTRWSGSWRRVPAAERAKVRADAHLGEARALLHTLETADAVLGVVGRRPPGSITVVPQPGVPPSASNAFDSIFSRPRSRTSREHGAPVVVALMDDDDGRSRRAGTRYVLPDRVAGDACLAIILDTRADRVPTSHSIGPCGFYAAFGVPGDSIRAWLDAWAWHIARNPQWMFDPAVRPLDQRLPAHVRVGWDLQRAQTEAHIEVPELYGCASGNPEACLAATRGGIDGYAYRSLTQGLRQEVLVSTPWWIRSSLGPGSDVYLSDVVAEFGSNAFGDFWRSDLPVEAAFEQAFETSLARWTMRWARSYLGVTPAGPRVRLASVLLGFAMVGVAVGGAAALVRFRQVA